MEKDLRHQTLATFLEEGQKGEKYGYVVSPGMYFTKTNDLSFDLLLAIHHLRHLRNEMPMFTSHNDKLMLTAWCCYPIWSSQNPSGTFKDFASANKFLERKLSHYQCDSVNTPLPHTTSFSNSFVLDVLLDKNMLKPRTQPIRISLSPDDIQYLTQLGFNQNEIHQLTSHEIPPPSSIDISVGNFSTKMVNPQWLAIFHKCTYQKDKTNELKNLYTSRVLIGQKDQNKDKVVLMCDCKVQRQVRSETPGFYCYKYNKNEPGTGINIPSEFATYLHYYYNMDDVKILSKTTKNDQVAVEFSLSF